MRKIPKIIAAVFLVALICYIPFYIVVFKILPERDPDNIFNRTTILQVLSGETRVFYDDGENLLGAFFDANHRVYVPYGDIPVNLINALIAAEDSRYWTHNGYDLKGFMRAMFNNIRAGHLRQGGSSLTQQAVKNISVVKNAASRKSSRNSCTRSAWKNTLPRKTSWNST